MSTSLRVLNVTQGPAEKVQALLAIFQDRVDGVRGIAIANKNGLPVSSSLTTKANVLTVTALATMAVQSFQRIYENLGLARPHDVVIAGPDSTVFVSSIAERQLSSIAVVDGLANLGLVRIEVERLGRDLSEIQNF